MARNAEWRYTYDDGGNITKKEEYNLSTGALRTSWDYGYGNSYWKDQLTSWGSYGTSSFAYDNAGNPTKYKGKTLTWQGKKLVRFANSALSYMDLSYDGNGLLVGYTQNDTYSDWAGAQFTNTTTKEIVRDGDKIINEKITEYNQLENTTSVKNVKYTYDEKGASGMSVNNVSYYFVRNIFGDVTAIYDESRNKKAEYSYDAWGACYMPVNEDGIGSINPFRYRGYYFVPQIGLYYLTTRFYDYMTGRFINADVPSICIDNGLKVPEGCNLYSYCLNNPIIYKKRSATFAGSNATTTNSISYTFSMGGLGTGNNSAPEWLQTVVGAIPDIMLCMRYLTAKGMHGKFAYSTSTRYIHPVMGGTWRWFGKSRSSRVNIGNVAQGTFRQLLTGDARAGIGSIAKSAGKAIGLIALVNFGFNLYENNWQIDSAMLKDTAIDTAIGVGAYYLAVGTMSLVTAGLVTAGIALPGIIVVGGVFLLSIGFEYIIRAIFGYWD